MLPLLGPLRAPPLSLLAAACVGWPAACASVDDRTPGVGVADDSARGGVGGAGGGSTAGASGEGGASGAAGASRVGASGEGGASGIAGSSGMAGAAGQGGTQQPPDPMPMAGACGGTALANPGFEQGAEAWTLFSSGPDPVVYEESDPQNVQFGVPAYEGTRLAWLGGAASLTERLTQPFSLPTTASSLAVSLFYRVRTNNPSSEPQDRASVSLTAGGETLSVLLELSNNTGTSDGWQSLATVVDVGAYAGSALTLVIQATQQTDGTSFFFDGLQTTIECVP